MRYRLRWRTDDRMRQMLTGDLTPGGALSFAYALLVEARPSDIWIETEGGRKVAGYAQIVEEGPIFSAQPCLNPGQRAAPSRDLSAS